MRKALVQVQRRNRLISSLAKPQRFRPGNPPPPLSALLAALEKTVYRLAVFRRLRDQARAWKRRQTQIWVQRLLSVSIQRWFAKELKRYCDQLTGS